jgi:hypothetical protein
MLEKLLNSESYYEILDLVVTYLGIGDSLVLRRASKECFKHVNHCLQRMPLKIDSQLRNFISDPDRFRSCLGKLNALIAGRFALNFFELGRCKVPDLDLSSKLEIERMD